MTAPAAPPPARETAPKRVLYAAYRYGDPCQNEAPLVRVAGVAKGPPPPAAGKP